MKAKLSGFKGFITAFLVTGLMAAFALWVNFEREEAIRHMKIEFQRLQNSMVEAGYDLSYSELKFNGFSLTSVMVIKDFRLNNLNADAYAEFYTEELWLNPSWVHIGEIDAGVNGEQRLTWGGKAHPVQMADFAMSFSFGKDTGLTSLHIMGRNMEIKDMAKIGEFRFSAKQMAAGQSAYGAPFFEDNIEVNNLEVTAPEPWPVSKKFDRVALTANMVGAVTPQATYKASLTDWAQHGGMIDIPELVVNWDYFSLVGKGDVSFNGSLEPKLHLNTSSKGVLDVLEALNRADVLDDKGVFVAKILLGNKAFKLKEDDKYATVTTPMDADKKGFNVEGITIRSW